MTDTSTPRRHRWWLVPLALVVLSSLLVADTYLLKPTIEQLSWKLASCNFDGWDIAATSENNIVLVGNRILHYNGLFWYRAPFSFFLADEEDQALQGKQNSEPTLRRSYEPPLSVVVAYDATHIYAAGTTGILRFNGLWWSQMPAANGLDAFARMLYVQNPDSIYAITRDNEVLYWNGRLWDNLVLPEQFHASAVSGTDDHVVIVGRNQKAFILTNGIWQEVNIPELVSALELSQYADPDFGLQPLTVYGLDDGRIIIGIYEYIDLGVIEASVSRLLLCYNGGDWFTVDVPEGQTLLDINVDDTGLLIAFDVFGNRYKQIHTGESLSWERIDDSAAPYFWGAYTFLDSGEMFVYGQIPTRIEQPCFDCLPEIKPPCSVEHYELAW